MIYKFSEYKLSNETKEQLESIAEGLRVCMTGLVNRKEYSHLLLSLQFIVDEAKNRNEKISVSSNADFNLQNSYSFVNEVNKYAKVCDTSKFPSDCCLNVSISFKPKASANEQQKPSDEKKEDALPQFVPVKPKYNFSQIILPESVKKEIMNSLAVIKYNKLIYDDWGFGEIESTPRSILNFYGPPGTGKSMCAHAIASELKKPLLALNYADIESKYVGEAAKNLKKAFETAEQLGAVMFFDEADSFLGKRIENVTTGSDQALNSLRSQMLIYLENFSGVVLFATNLVTNFDRAFESRILNHIKFELPNKEARAEIIKKMIPEKLPKDRDFTQEDYLAASELIEGMSGREIKTAIQGMLLKEAQEHGGSSIFTVDILKAALKEKKDSIDKLKAEENERLKLKITKKLKEKAEEEKMTEEYEAEKKNEEEKKGEEKAES